MSANPPKQTKTQEVLGTLPLLRVLWTPRSASSFTDLARVQTLQILHKQCDHLPVHLRIREAREGYMSQDGPLKRSHSCPPLYGTSRVNSFHLWSGRVLSSKISLTWRQRNSRPHYP